MRNSGQSYKQLDEKRNEDFGKKIQQYKEFINKAELKHKKTKEFIQNISMNSNNFYY